MTERRTDTRIPLDEGYCVKDKNSAGHSFTIKGEFARGGSSIIYRAEGADGEVLLKELFPAYGCFREDGKIKARRSGNDLLAELAVRMDTEFSIGKKAFEESAWVENIGKPFVSSDGNHYSAMKISRPHASLKDILALPECADVSIHAWAELIRRISQSVRDIHEKADILHLDISLSNILVIGSNSPLDMLKAIASNDGRSAAEHYSIMLIDFGCSLHMDKQMQSANKYYISPTTEGYSAPELLIDGYGPVTPAADIYSICACLKKCVEKIPEETYRDLPATVRAKLEAVLRKGLAEDPMYRIKSAERLLQNLEELLSRIDGKGVSKAAIWEAAKRDYKSKLKGRFSGLGPSEIIEEIFPLGHQVSLDVQASTDEGSPQNVLDLIHEHAGEDLLIVGAGGVGKTTTLVKILQEEYGDENGYDENTTVPIYVELNNAPEKIHELVDLKNHDGSTFILCYIASLLRNVKYSEVGSEMLESIRDEFRKETAEPEYLLLLDGLNEVSSKWNAEVSSSVQGTLILEIRKLLKESPNIRAIVTSRTEHNGIDASNEVSFTKISLSGISDEMVYDYIKACNREERIPIVENNAGLRECLHIPLFLMMYCGIIAEYEDITSRGEILRYFWNEVTERYSQSRIAKTISANREMSASMRMFILDFIAPALCDEMEKNNTFSMGRREIKEIINGVLNDTGDTGILGKYGVECFVKDICDDDDNDIAETAEEISEIFHSTKGLKRMLDELINMGILYRIEERNYGVRHHFFRDYFAAVYTVNMLNLAVFIDKPSLHSNLTGNRLLSISTLRNLWIEPIGYDRSVMVGEYLGEHRNVPIFDNGRWQIKKSNHREEDDMLIEKVLDIYRYRFDGSDGYAVYSLFSILERVKIDLSGCDFSNLDLSCCKLNGVILGREGLGSNFCGARISSENLFPCGHSGAIHHASFSPGDKLIVTSSADGTAKIWDASTYNTINTLLVFNDKEMFTDSVYYAQFSVDSKSILTLSPFSTAMIWNAHTLSKKEFLLENESIRIVKYSKTGQWILTVSDNFNLYVYDAKDSYIYCSRRIYVAMKSAEFYINDAAFCQDENKIIYTTDIDVIIWNWRDDSTYSVPFDFDGVQNASCSPNDEKVIITMNKSHYAIILSLTTPEDPKAICDTKSFIKYAEYSKNGEYIITVSNDHWTLWDAANLTSIGSRYGHYDSILSATFNRNGSKVISTSYDRNAVVYNIPDLSFAGCLYGHHNGLITAKYDSLGQSIIAAARDEIIIYSLQTQKVSLTIGDLYGITSADFNSIRNIIASASEDKCVKIHDFLCGKLIMTLNGHAGSINHVEFSKTGERLLTVSNDSVILWETETGEMTMRLNLHFPAHAASFISNSKFIVVTGENHQLCICDIYANRDLCQNTIIDLNSVCNSSGFESILWRAIEGMTYIAVNDGKNQIAASVGFDIVLYDIFEKETQVLPQMHCSVVTALSYSPNGQKLASADVSGNIIVWHDNRPALTMESHSSRINSICFSPDGSSILAASDDGAIIIWDISGYMHSSIAIDGSRVIKHTSGLIVMDCDFRNLHPDSKLSEEDKATLRQYGAILD